MTTKPRPAMAVPSTLAVLLLALSGCGGAGSSGATGSSESSGASSAGTSAGSGTQDRALSAPAAPQSSGSQALGSSPAANAVAPLSRSVVSTGELVVRTSDIDRARSRATALVTAWGGLVADEQTSSDNHGRALESTLTLRVPGARFAGAMDALARLGTVDQQSRTSTDVTTKVIDNDARVRAAAASIRRVEALLGRATRLGEVISIESDLARRQADLDSLRSQQKYLADQTSLSTVQLSLTRTNHRVAPPARTSGFVAGLAHGWHALGGATVAALTVLGAVLPFVLLAGLLGVPVWLLRRRRTPAAAPEA